MNQARAGFAQQQRPDAGVAEQVEHLGSVRPRPHPIPLRRHVREERKVAERSQ